MSAPAPPAPRAPPMTWRRVADDARRLLSARYLGVLLGTAVLAMTLPALLGLALAIVLPGVASALAPGAALAGEPGSLGAALALVLGAAALTLAALSWPLAYLSVRTRRELDPAYDARPAEVASRALPRLLGGLVLSYLLVAGLALVGLLPVLATGALAGGVPFFLVLVCLLLAGLLASVGVVLTTLVGPFAVIDGRAPREALRGSRRRVGPRVWRVLGMLLALVILPSALLGAALVLLGPALLPLAAGLPFALHAALAAVLHFQATQAPPAVASGYLVEARSLRQWFPIRGGVVSRTRNHVRAVDGVDLRIPRGKTVGLVGESGCGKTTAGRTLLRLLAATDGSVVFDGADITHLEGPELREFRARAQIVFQDPMSSLNPRMTIRQILSEPLRFTAKVPRDEIDRRVEEALERVGLKPNHADRYPHEFSGGQRQRIGIARALATNPEFIVLDEPTSALDVSVQAQVLNLLRRLQAEMGLTYLFISHDLSVIRHMCDEVAIMYLGQIVEHGPVDEIFRNPQHPYTQALLSAVPLPDPDRKAKRILLTGDVPSPVNPPSACRFHPRCPRAQPNCAVDPPPLEEKRPGQLAACHYPGPQEKWPLTQTKEVKVSDT